MRKLTVACALLAAAPFFPLGGATRVDLLAHRGAGAADWVEVVEHKLDDARVRRPKGQGAMGASVVGVSIGSYRGSIVVELLERGAVAAFLGWDIDRRSANRAGKDLRVVWHELSGKKHETALAAGGGNAILFHSPDAVPVDKLSHFTLMRRAKATWAKGKRRR